MKSPSVKRNFLFNLIYQIFVFITPIVTTPYVSRVLSADGIGEYSYSVSIVTYFSLFGTFGLSTYGQLEIAKNRENMPLVGKIIRDIFIIRCITMLVSIIVYCLTVIHSNENKTIYLILLLGLIGIVFDFTFVYQGLELFDVLAIRNLIVKTSGIILIFLAVKKRDDLYIYAGILECTCIISNIFLCTKVLKILQFSKGSKVSLADMKQHVYGSVQYFIPTIATMVYTVLDKSMIGWITKSNAQNGFYEQSHKLEQMLVSVVIGLSTVTLPRMAYYYKNNERKAISEMMEKTIRFILFISIPMCIGVSSCAKILIPVYLGEGFEESINLLKIFSTLIVIVGLDNTIGKQALIAAGKQRKYNIGVILGALFNVILNIIMIPRLMSVGAAIASVSAELLILIYFIISCRGEIIPNRYIKCFMRYCGIAIFMGVIVSLIGEKMGVSILTLAIQVISGGAIYFTILILLKDEVVISVKTTFFDVVKSKFTLNTK